MYSIQSVTVMSAVDLGLWFQRKEKRWQGRYGSRQPEQEEHFFNNTQTAESDTERQRKLESI